MELNPLERRVTVQAKIYYEDNHLLIVEKPANMPVQADNSRDLDLLTFYKQFIKERDNKPGNVYLGLVHRLDRPVAGLIIFAKTSKAASRLSDALRRRALDRSYLAVVHGQPKKDSGQLTDYLWKDKKKNQSYVVASDHRGAKKAQLTYQVLDQTRDFSLVRIQLQTGRSHQIRVQMEHLGHPLYGDQKYGAKVNQVGQQIALWAYQVHLQHPVKKEDLTVQALPPATGIWSHFDLSQL